MSAWEPRRTLRRRRSSVCCNWSGRPIVAEQGRNLDPVDQSSFRGRIEIAHRSFVEIDDTTGLERSDIVDLDDGLFVGSYHQGISWPIILAITDAAKLINMNRGGPRVWIIGFAGGSI